MQAQNESQDLGVTYLKDYQTPSYLCPEILLEIDINAQHTLVRSTLSLVRNATSPNATLALDCDELELVEISINGEKLQASEYTVSNHQLIILDPPKDFDLVTVAKIHPDKNTQLMGLYRSQDGYFTQCEAEGFRRITYSLDRPDVMSKFTTIIHGDKNTLPLLLSNGNIEASGEEENGRHWVRWRDPFPKPAYLFAMVAAKLDGIETNFKTKSGRDVMLYVYVEPGKADQAGFALEALQAAMRWDEEVFGLELDLDQYIIVAVSDFNMGAMENKGLNIFNTKYVLASPETASDSDYMMLDRVVAHEYFHNWTGNRVTCRDWFQLSLKEGLTVFRDQEYGGDRYSQSVQRIQEVRVLRSSQFPEDAGPMAHPIRPESYMEISNFYTATVYNKGAEVVRMIHTLIGAKAFRKGMDLYFERHDGQAVRTEEFVCAMADASGYDLEQFKRWYSQAGTPTVSANGSYDASSKQYTIRFEQSTPPTPEQATKQAFHIPLQIGLLDSNGHELAISTQSNIERGIFSLKGTHEEITFEGLERAPIPSLLRGFSAPVKLDFDYSDEDLALLMAHDTDPFNQWEAGQRLSLKVILDAITYSRAGRQYQYSETFLHAFGVLLNNAATDPAFTAEALKLPSAGYVAENMSEVDAEAIYLVANDLYKNLAKCHEPAFKEVLEKFTLIEPYSPDPVSAGSRALANTALGYLMANEDEEIEALCLKKLTTADNMTNAGAAFAVLVHSESDLKYQALEFFYDKWKNEALVLDKWFAVQASSPQADALRTVKQLLNHPEFSLTNPNRARSVIGVFCHGNHRNFHAADGSGYEFAADQIIQLDPANAQLAARIARCFDRWRKFDQQHQDHAQRQLQRILDVPKLSKDTHEVISRALS